MAWPVFSRSLPKPSTVLQPVMVSAVMISAIVKQMSFFIFYSLKKIISSELFIFCGIFGFVSIEKIDKKEGVFEGFHFWFVGV